MRSYDNDPLVIAEQTAEGYARKLASSKTDFRHLTAADRAVMLVLLQRIEAQDRIIQRLEQAIGQKKADARFDQE